MNVICMDSKRCALFHSGRSELAELDLELFRLLTGLQSAALIHE